MNWSLYEQWTYISTWRLTTLLFLHIHSLRYIDKTKSYACIWIYDDVGVCVRVCSKARKRIAHTAKQKEKKIVCLWTYVSSTFWINVDSIFFFIIWLVTTPDVQFVWKILSIQYLYYITSVYNIHTCSNKHFINKEKEILNFFQLNNWMFIAFVRYDIERLSTIRLICIAINSKKVKYILNITKKLEYIFICCMKKKIHGIRFNDSKNSRYRKNIIKLKK